MSAVFFRTRSDLGLNGGNEVKTHSMRLKEMGRKPPKKKKRKSSSGSSSDATAHAEREKENERWRRRPMNAGDLRFALGRGDLGFGQSKAIVKSVMGGWEEGVLEGWSQPRRESDAEVDVDVDDHDDAAVPDILAAATATATARKKVQSAPAPAPAMNGIYHDEVDDGWGWEGGGKGDRIKLGGLLDQCLAIGQS